MEIRSYTSTLPPILDGLLRKGKNLPTTHLLQSTAPSTPSASTSDVINWLFQRAYYCYLCEPDRGVICIYDSRKAQKEAGMYNT